MSQEHYSDLDEYTDEEYSTGESEGSNSLSDLSTSTSNMPELFTVKTGECPGDYDRIELLIRQAKTLDILDITEQDKWLIFKNIFIRSEAESIESEPWITSFFSTARYPELQHVLHPKLRSAIEKLPDPEMETIIISSRFTNVPEEVIFEMYEAFGVIFKKLVAMEPDTSMLLLSLEKPVGPDEEAEIRRVFPKYKFPKGTKLFPEHTEDVFFVLNNILPIITCHIASNLVIKVYRLDAKVIDKFVAIMLEYYA